MVSSISFRHSSSALPRATTLNVPQDKSVASEPKITFSSASTLPAKTVEDMDAGDRVRHYNSIGDATSAHQEDKKLALTEAQQELDGLKFGLDGARRMANDWQVERDSIQAQLSSAPSDRRDRLMIELNIAETQIIASRNFLESSEKYLAEGVSRLQPRIDALTTLLGD